MTPAQVAAAVIAIAIGARLWLILNHYPPADSDEAAMGLGALHIGKGQDFPVFLYGQHYMGAIEAYLAAPLLALFGHSVVLLRLPTLILYAVFLVAMYRLTIRLYTPWFGVVVVAALAFGADRVLKDELIAHGGSAEIKPAATLLFLIALGLATDRYRRRGLAFFCWALIAGLALWDHLLILPYLAMAGAVLIVRCRRELGGRRGGLLALGALLGAAPLIGYNVVAAAGEDSLTVFLHQNGGPPAGIAERLGGGVLLGVPLSTGVCDPGVCTPWQRAWAPLCLGLLGASCWLAVRALRARGSADRAPELARLVLALAGLVTIAAYTRSSAAGLTPIESARYLSCLPASVPAILWPLWRPVTTTARARTGPAVAGPAIAGLAVLAVLFAAMAAATVSTITVAVPRAVAADRSEQHLLQTLEAEGTTRIYSEYWTCNRLIFDSGERVLCAVVGDDLRPGWDRYLPYRATLASTGRPAYVFPTGTAPDTAFRAHLRALGRPDVPAEVVGPYSIYRPDGPVGVPLPPR